MALRDRTGHRAPSGDVDRLDAPSSGRSATCCWRASTCLPRPCPSWDSIRVMTISLLRLCVAGEEYSSNASPWPHGRFPGSLRVSPTERLHPLSVISRGDGKKAQSGGGQPSFRCTLVALSLPIQTTPTSTPYPPHRAYHVVSMSRRNSSVKIWNLVTHKSLSGPPRPAVELHGTLPASRLPLRQHRARLLHPLRVSLAESPPRPSS